MTKQEIINNYKKDRSITDDYKLDEDESYLIDKIYEAINFTHCCETLSDLDGKSIMVKFKVTKHIPTIVIDDV